MRVALLVVLLLAAAGIGCIIAGIAMLAGPAWALLVSGLMLFALAALLRAGLIRNA